MWLTILSFTAHLSSLLAMAATAYFFGACTMKEKHEYTICPSHKSDKSGWEIWTATRHQLESKRTKIFMLIMACYLLAMACMGPLIALTKNLGLPTTELLVLLAASACIPVVAVLRTARHDTRLTDMQFARDMASVEGF